MSQIDWSKEDQKAAFMEGWLISESGDAVDDQYQIQRVDDPEAWEQFDGVPCAVLSDDADAWELVLSGDKPHHVKARTFIQANSPKEWQRMNADPKPSRSPSPGGM
jgi:hypothetical protein